jgi:hypothetical protein
MIAQIIYCVFIISVMVNVLICVFDRRKYKRKYEREERRTRQLEREQRTQQRHVDRLTNRNRELLGRLNEREITKGPVINGAMTSYLDCLGVMGSDWQEGDEERLDDLWQEDEQNLEFRQLVEDAFNGNGVVLDGQGRIEAMRQRLEALRQRNEMWRVRRGRVMTEEQRAQAQEAINRMVEEREEENEDFLLYDNEGNEYIN